MKPATFPRTISTIAIHCVPLTPFSVYFIVQSKHPTHPEHVGGTSHPGWLSWQDFVCFMQKPEGKIKLLIHNPTKQKVICNCSAPEGQKYWPENSMCCGDHSLTYNQRGISSTRWNSVLSSCFCGYPHLLGQSGKSNLKKLWCSCGHLTRRKKRERT